MGANDLARIVNRLHDEFDMTDEEIAVECNCTAVTVRNWRIGKAKRPVREHAKALDRLITKKLNGKNAA